MPIHHTCTAILLCHILMRTQCPHNFSSARISDIKVLFYHWICVGIARLCTVESRMVLYQHGVSITFLLIINITIHGHIFVSLSVSISIISWDWLWAAARTHTIHNTTSTCAPICRVHRIEWDLERWAIDGRHSVLHAPNFIQSGEHFIGCCKAICVRCGHWENPNMDTVSA